MKTEKTQKKDYVAPVMEEIKLRQMGSLLQDSEGYDPPGYGDEAG